MSEFCVDARKRLVCALSLMLAVAGLNAADATNAPARTASSSRPRIEWDAGTLSLIQTNGFYARIIRLQDGRLVCGFDFQRKIWVRHSSDGGKTWGDRVLVAEWPFGRLTNTELLQLRDGTLLCFYNERPQQPPATADPATVAAAWSNTPPHAICMVRSRDGGETWSKPDTLYRAGPEFINGCWEPAAVELPSGEVQVFFANEGPYRHSDEQEITMLRSSDGARTWAAPERVSFRPGTRDGMPVPHVLKDGRGVAFAIEDNGLSGQFKPVIVYSSLEDNWRSGARMPESTNRWGALRVPLAPDVYAGGPYLRQMPTGETLLSFQQSDSDEMNLSRMVVYIGDANARNFDHPSTPFPRFERVQLWNSLFVKDEQTIIAVSETSFNGVRGIWSIEGRFIRE